jgi:predicted metalloprotease
VNRLQRTVAVTALLLGAVLGAMLGAPVPAHAEAPRSCSGTRTPATFRACIADAATAYTQLWAPLIALHGGSGTAPTIRIFTGVPLNPCFDATVGDVAVASFWCDEDSSVYVSAPASPYWTREYAREAKRQGVLSSDAARVGRTQNRLLRGFANQGAATELAHELGHWVQTQTGLATWYQERSAGSTARAGRYGSAFELSADCMAGWVQGRAAATGRWRNTPFIRWAGHATIAELGGDMTGMKPHFRFPPERPVIGHGGPQPRLQMYDVGWLQGVSNSDAVTGCADAAARLTSTDAPPPSLVGR